MLDTRWPTSNDQCMLEYKGPALPAQHGTYPKEPLQLQSSPWGHWAEAAIKPSSQLNFPICLFLLLLSPTFHRHRSPWHSTINTLQLKLCSRVGLLPEEPSLGQHERKKKCELRPQNISGQMVRWPEKTVMGWIPSRIQPGPLPGVSLPGDNSGSFSLALSSHLSLPF